jgi:hypothetical protein
MLTRQIYCSSTDVCAEHSFYPRKPEILIVTCPPRTHYGSQILERFSYRVRLEDEISIGAMDKEQYVLTGAILVTGETWITKIGHVVACVRGPDGNNNSVVVNHL